MWNRRPPKPHQARPVRRLLTVVPSALVALALLTLTLPRFALADEAEGGVVWAWGTNPTGELSDAAVGDSTLPVQVSRITGLVEIAGNGHHTLALKNDGTVWAWGANASGQLGNGAISNVPNPVPTQVLDLGGVVDTEAGVSHSVVLKSDGTVWAWGDNSAGQLGSVTETRTVTHPMQVGGLSDVTAISGGDHHTVALKSDDTVWAWGDNGYNQLGNGTTQDSTVPVQVNGLSEIIAVDGGIFHTLALKNDGTVWAWGANYYAQLGDGTTNNASAPVRVGELTDVTAIAAGVAHSLALKSDGTVWAWGWNDAGQLSIETSTRIRGIPVLVTGVTEVTAIAGGLAHSLALKADGTVWGWGDNSAGQLGNGTNWQSSKPVQALGLSGITAIAAGDGHSLALQTISGSPAAPLAQLASSQHGGVALSWADQSADEEGFRVYRGGELVATLSPDTTAFVDEGAPCGVPQAYKVAAFAASGQSAASAFPATTAACPAAGSAGAHWAWGSNAFGQLGDGTDSWNNASICLPVRDLSGARAVAGGAFHSLALLQDGTVWAWGRNQWGQLGNGGGEDSTSPVAVSGLTDVTAISGGASHSLALKSDGTVWAWGDNFSGQLGNGSEEDSPVPVQVLGDGFVAIAAGGSHSLALKSDGTVWTWGRNYSGQLGDGTTWDSSEPVQVVSLTDVTEVAAGIAHSLVLKSDGTVWAWGENTSGQLGGGNSRVYSSYSSTPGQVVGLSEVRAIDGGVAYSLALKSDGTVWTWGRYRYGDRELLLSGRTVESSHTATMVPGLDSVTAIAAGGVHSLALKSDGTVWAWGWNNAGQLGNGANWDSVSPIQVGAVSGATAIGAGVFHSLALESPATTVTP